MKKFIILFVTLFGIATTQCAMADDKKDYEKSYNHLRGVECLEKENLEEAIQYFGKEVEEHPKGPDFYESRAARPDVLQRLGKIEIDNDRDVIRIIRTDSQEAIVTSTVTVEETEYVENNNPHTSLGSINQTKQTSLNKKGNENS